MALDVPTLRSLFRGLRQFEATYEQHGVDQICLDGECWTIYDLRYLNEQTRQLPPRQYQAIQMCLVENMREVDAAVAMGVSPTNPVAAYAASGLANLIEWIHEGRFPRFQEDQVA